LSRSVPNVPKGPACPSNTPAVKCPLRDKWETCLPLEAFEPIACALGKSVERPSLEALRDRLLEDFCSFHLSCTADKSTRAKWEREREKRNKAATKLLSSLQSGLSVLDMPRVLLDEAFREKFMRVLETLARPPRRDRLRRLDAFRYHLVPGLIWVYEHLTREKALKPYWLGDSRVYGGKFYHFACAVRHCLLDCVPEVREALPLSDVALAEELRGHSRAGLGQGKKTHSKGRQIPLRAKVAGGLSPPDMGAVSSGAFRGLLPSPKESTLWSTIASASSGEKRLRNS
jgi:hypothetical protein